MITIKIKKSKSGEFYATIQAKNHKYQWKLSETVKREATVERAIDIIVTGISDGQYKVIDETKEASNK